MANFLEQERGELTQAQGMAIVETCIIFFTILALLNGMETGAAPVDMLIRGGSFNGYLYGGYWTLLWIFVGLYGIRYFYRDLKLKLGNRIFLTSYLCISVLMVLFSLYVIVKLN